MITQVNIEFLFMTGGMKRVIELLRLRLGTEKMTTLFGLRFLCEVGNVFASERFWKEEEKE